MLDPYNYSFDDNSSTYKFTTKNKVIYSIAFIEDHTLTTTSTSGIEFNNMYQIVVEKITKDIEPLDARVSLTIDLIISDFFRIIENALIYVCSEEKGQEQKRLKTFERWYNNSNNKDYINKVDNVFNFKESSSILYTSLLYHKENKHADCILNAFNEIGEVLNSKQ